VRGEEDLAAHWARARPLLARAARGPRGLEAAERAVAEGRAWLWPGRRSAAVSEVTRDFHIWLAGGELAELLEMERSACAWARALGCDRMTLIGRRGWSRVLKDYRTETLLVKDL
jgi:hypothetical protein